MEELAFPAHLAVAVVHTVEASATYELEHVHPGARDRRVAIADDRRINTTARVTPHLSFIEPWHDAKMWR